MRLNELKSSEFLPAFAWAIGPFFRETLERCHFEPNGIYYSSRKGYDPWPGEGIPCEFFEVSQSDGDPAKSFANNWRRPVTVHFYAANGTREYKDTTQGSLYSLLWTGDKQHLKDQKFSPPVPGHLGVTLRRAMNREKVLPEELLVPFDMASSDSVLKVRKIEIALGQKNPEIRHPSDYCSDSPIKPTVFLAVFSFKAEEFETITEQIKLHISPDSKKFRLGAHAFFSSDH